VSPVITYQNLHEWGGYRRRPANERARFPAVFAAVKYATADTQILATKGQVLKSRFLTHLPSYLPRFWAYQLNSAVSALVSARILAYFPLDLELQTFAYFAVAFHV